MKDLFGQPIPDLPIKIGTKASGYARRPGTGPAGERCGTCLHAVRIGAYNHKFYKCNIIRFRWTHGPGTDILLKSPACKMWSKDNKS